MSSPVPPGFRNPLPRNTFPFVPEHMEMKEFTLRAVLLGLLMTIVLGAANAYLGLRARYHHRGNLSRRRDRNGGNARVEGISARRKHCPYRGIDRRVRCRRSYLHVARVSSSQGVAVVPLCRRVLEIHCADHGG